jgi:demethylmenaquinone methyltransferase/2-methoxy-6-polyprenyl-1,4-benzoquinol methylase
MADAPLETQLDPTTNDMTSTKSRNEPSTVGDVPPNGQLDKSETRVREMFRQIAPKYDLMNHLLSLNIDRYWRWQTVRRIRFESSAPILDTCTGTGDLALAISRKAPQKVDVIGSDFCRAMLEIANQKSDPETKGDRRVRFLEADSQYLPFADELFQCVTVAFGLRNVTDTLRGLREMARVCRPGGQVLVLEFSRPRTWGLRQSYNFYFTHILPKVGQWLARNDKSAYSYLPESVGQFPDGPALVELMTTAGLVDVSYTPLTCGIATIYEGRKPAA